MNDKSEILDCSVGIFTHSREKNFDRILNEILRQKLDTVRINQILIIFSGSTKKIEHTIKKYVRLDTRIRILVQKKRKGKASAVNLFIQKAKNEVLVLINSDLLLPDDLIQNLVCRFIDKQVGMTGAHPIPVNKKDEGLFNFAGYLLWDLHHRISLIDPKMGEAVAFRKIFRRIPMSSSTDEANIEPLIKGQGYKIVYIPKARVYNKAPTNLRDFIAQRRRVYSGHLALKDELGYSVSTLNLFIILRALFSFIGEDHQPKFFILIPLASVLEISSRFLGWWDYKIRKKSHMIWKFIPSAKDF